MIIKTDESKYKIPLKIGINILFDNEHSKSIISFIFHYFGNKKKNNCVIFDDNESIIQPKEFTLIYVSKKENVENNYKFKDHTILNTFTSEYILNNPKSFISIDIIRNNISNLLTDSGIYNLRRIMFNNLTRYPEILLNDFSVSKIIEMLQIENNSDESTMIASLYNLLIYNHQKENLIIYIDFIINDNLTNWLKWLNDLGFYVIINSNSFEKDIKLDNIYALIPSKNDELIELELIKNDFNKLLYLLKPFIIKNIKYQKEENIHFLENFTDDFATYSIKIV